MRIHVTNAELSKRFSIEFQSIICFFFFNKSDRIVTRVVTKFSTNYYPIWFLITWIFYLKILQLFNRKLKKNWILKVVFFSCNQKKLFATCKNDEIDIWHVELQSTALAFYDKNKDSCLPSITTFEFQEVRKCIIIEKSLFFFYINNLNQLDWLTLFHLSFKV